MTSRTGYSVLAMAIVVALAGCAQKREVMMQDAAGSEELDAVVVTGTRIATDPAPAQSPVSTPNGVQLNPDGIGQNLVYPPLPGKVIENSGLFVGGNRHRGTRDCSALPGGLCPEAEAEADLSAETYAATSDNPPKRASEEPLSTFSIDVDTGSYANVRSLLMNGQKPPVDAVRAEEFINYFDYDYPLPTSGNPPFSVTTEFGPAPWNARRELLLIGLKGYELPDSQLPKSNLVFLLDVSGSMDEPNKLPLLKNALSLLVNQLDADDSVAIVVYAGAAGMVLPPTSGADKARILRALDSLSAGGSTNGGQGIELAYALAREARIAGGINRVILATDGDFNVGISDVEQLKAKIAAERADGIALTTLGFGRGNYNDELSEQLADVGNGNHYYIDTLNEARKVLVEQRGSTLFTIAKDVKIQIEFNPQLVSEYRLIGYQNRVLANQDFANDQKDAGEIGAGHEVTALYELALVGSGGEQLPELRYSQPANTENRIGSRELAFLKLRYKPPGSDRSQLIETPIAATAGQTSERLRFAAAVAGFAELLRGSAGLTEFGYARLSELAASAIGRDAYGYRGEFLQLVQTAARMQ